jgi:hypothetical protein
MDVADRLPELAQKWGLNGNCSLSLHQTATL